MSTQPIDPWSGHNHPHVEDAECPEGCPKAEEAPKPLAVVTEEPKKAARKAATRRPRPRGDNRASGLPAAVEEAEKSATESTEPIREDALPEDRAEWDRNPGFQRMKTAWEGEDKRQMDRVQVSIQRRLWETFPEALAVMNDLYTVVREPVVNETTGEVAKDAYGQPVWKKDPFTNVFVEDWTLLTVKQREHFLFRITSALFEWEQRAADLWTEAMFSKGMFTERFAIEYDAPMHGTIDDRNAVGNKEAAEERYFALMNSALSRKADALVRTMTNLQLRLKDTLGQ